nr:non-ribosomal peptide synthetase [Candidatus Eremiobacteraeota bacterium]
GPGTPVAVRLPKGPDHITAVLGIAAAGAAFVPVGTDQPEARFERIRHVAGFTVVLDDLAEALATPALEAPVSVSSESLAYVIFTSGSTGEPKGVEIAHRAAVNTVEDVNARFATTANDRVLALSALDFDLSVYDVFGLLSAGGALVLIDDADRREPRRWLDAMRRWGVTVWNSVPALLDMLLVAAHDEGLRAPLRLALLSGDWIGLDLPERLALHAPGCRFVALGGATEASIWSNACEVLRVADDWTSIPYGTPLRNQRFRAVDARGRDCPDWVPGELWIGGTGVALGYRNDPGETARRFVERGGERWYRTGDRGRYRPDGTLEFLGRADQQVKLRGYRIELVEIEAALEAHPDVIDAVALVAGRRAPSLAAVVVPARAESFDPAAVRRFAAERLPAYMVPERIVATARLPLTATGKVDRNAVAATFQDEPPTTPGDPPRGRLERALAQMWSDLLEVPRVGRRDNFFALGGDSLAAIRLMEAVRHRFGADLALRALFAAPTIADLATDITAQQRTAAAPDVEAGAV